MSAVQISGNASGTGTLTIAAPSTNTNRTLTLPDNTGTLLTTGSTFAGTGPTFSVIYSSLSVPTATVTYFTTCTTSFDTASCVNLTTGRVLPLIAGYYFVTGQAGYDVNGITASSVVSGVQKNGADVNVVGGVGQASAYPRIVCSGIIYCNGTTDYLQLYAYQNGATTATSVYGRLFGALIRAA